MENLNKMSAPKKGKDMRESPSIHGTGSETQDFKSKNELTEYVAERGDYGTIGGKNTMGGN